MPHPTGRPDVEPGRSQGLSASSCQALVSRAALSVLSRRPCFRGVTAQEKSVSPPGAHLRPDVSHSGSLGARIVGLTAIGLSPALVGSGGAIETLGPHEIAPQASYTDPPNRIAALLGLRSGSFRALRALTLPQRAQGVSRPHTRRCCPPLMGTRRASRSSAGGEAPSQGWRSARLAVRTPAQPQRRCGALATEARPYHRSGMAIPESSC